MSLSKTRKQRDENRKWVCRMQGDLQGPVDKKPQPATIFQVPASVREVSENSYNPKYLSFGPYNRRNSLLYTIRLDFIKIFKKITGKEWDDIYSEALQGKSIEDWMKSYEGLRLDHQVEEKKNGEKDDGKKKAAAEEDDGKRKIEENDAKEEPETFLAWEEETGERFLVWDAIFVVCFLIADHYRTCRRTCQVYFKFLDPLKKEIEKKTVAPLVHLIRLDIFKFENQIPLGLVKNVYDIVSRTYNDQPSTSTARNDQPSTPNTEHKRSFVTFVKNFVCSICRDPERPEGSKQLHAERKLSFDRFVTDSVCCIYCDLPKPVDLDEFKLIMPKLDFERRRHLLECLYSVVCYQLNPPQSTMPSDVKEPESDQPIGDTGQLSGNIGNHGVPTDPPSMSNPKKSNALWRFLGGLASTLRKPRGIGSADEENQGACELAQIRNVGGGEDTSGPTQDDTVKSDGDAGPSQNSNVGSGEGTSGAQDDKGKSLQSDAGPPKNSNGGRGVETGGGVQRDKGKTLLGDADPGQSSTGAGGGGTTAEIQCDEGKSPQGDAPPSGHPRDARGDSRDSSAKLGWCSKQEHNHCQFTPTITKLRAANIEVKVGQGNGTKWISEVHFSSSSLFSYKGELYLPVFGVYDETEALLRNLLVYEYIIVPKQKELRSFIHLMSNLINDEEDVRWMKESGVLKNNSLGTDQDVADMWKTMLSGVVINLSRDYQFKVFDKIAKHRKKTIPKIVGELRLLYNNRWQRFGILAALVTIVATVSAAIYTILTYYYGNKQRAQT